LSTLKKSTSFTRTTVYCWLQNEGNAPKPYLPANKTVVVLKTLVLEHAWAPGLVHPHVINPLTTDDECSRHATLAGCYQLAQSVLKIGFALAKKVGWGRWVGFSAGYRAHGNCLGWL